MEIETRIKILESHFSTILAELNNRIKRLEVQQELNRSEIIELKSKVQTLL